MLKLNPKVYTIEITTKPTKAKVFYKGQYKGITPLSCTENQECSDESGLALCICKKGYQDNDNDDICKPSCANNYSCSSNEYCDDSSGTVKCVAKQDDRLARGCNYTNSNNNTLALFFLFLIFIFKLKKIL